MILPDIRDIMTILIAILKILNMPLVLLALAVLIVLMLLFACKIKFQPLILEAKADIKFPICFMLLLRFIYESI